MSGERLQREEQLSASGPNLLIFVRHGQSQRNLAKGGEIKFSDQEAISPVQGIPSYLIELTEEGRRQAKTTGASLFDRFPQIDHVYHSGYMTTMQTTEELLTAFPKKPSVTMDSMIRERDPGYTYEMTADDISTNFPWLKQHWDTFGRFYGKAPGGENLIQVAQRARYFLDDIFRKHNNKSVLVVTHAGTLQSFRFIMEGWSYQEADRYLVEQKPGNCTVVAYGSTDLDRKLSIGLEKPEVLDLGYKL